MPEALLWAGAITGAEGVARRALKSRSKAWLAAYLPLGIAGAALDERERSTRDGNPWPEVAIGLAFAFGGYQVGRILLGDHRSRSSPPPDDLVLELIAVGGVVAITEEVTWGGIVEPALGIGATSALFAAKHIAIDGRWRRGLGLALFWIGLGLLRRRSRALAALVHVAANTGAVVQGHATGIDRF